MITSALICRSYPSNLKCIFDPLAGISAQSSTGTHRCFHILVRSLLFVKCVSQLTTWLWFQESMLTWLYRMASVRWMHLFQFATYSGHIAYITWFPKKIKNRVDLRMTFVYIRWMGLKWLIFLILSCICLVCSSVTNIEVTPERHMFKRDWMTSSNINTALHSIVNTIGKTYVFG